MAKYYTQFEDLSTFTSFQNIPSTLHSLTNIPYYQNNHHHHHHQIPILDFTHQSSSISCNNSSTSDEAEENHMSIINERKQRRMISNRESARRSRMRKQKQLDELCTQLLRLRNEHHELINKLNHFSEIHEQVVQENDRLKKETIELKQLLTEAQIATTYSNFSDHQEDHGDHDQNVVLPSSTTESSTSSGSFNLLN
ncbi:putative transcription factor bZIP family [Helianthus debilis subsp. tardiflorus]